jgi:hypothetical protein
MRRVLSDAEREAVFCHSRTMNREETTAGLPENEAALLTRARADMWAKGVKLVRDPILAPRQRQEAGNRIDAGEPQRSMASSSNVSHATNSVLAL